MTNPERPGFLRPMSMRGVSRALPSALTWAYVTLIVGAILLTAVGLGSYLVLGALWLFDRSREVAAPTWAAVGTSAWVAGPVAVGAAVWGAAYASTTARSVPRSVVGTVAAVAVGSGLLALGASLFAFAALAIGWALAIPAHSVGRIAARGAVPTAVAVLAMTWGWGQIDTYLLWQVAVLLVASPPVAALWVWLSDAVWMAARSARGTTDPV